MQLGAIAPKLAALGVQAVAIVNTRPERARLYFRHRPVPLPVAADPDAAAHRAFGLPAIEIGPAAPDGPGWPFRATPEEFGAVRLNPTGELAAALPIPEAMAELNRRDGFELDRVDLEMQAAHGTQLAGHFLVDRDGIVRWTHVEGRERIAELTKFPGEEEILRAARALGGALGTTRPA